MLFFLPPFFFFPSLPPFSSFPIFLYHTLRNTPVFHFYLFCFLSFSSFLFFDGRAYFVVFSYLSTLALDLLHLDVLRLSVWFTLFQGSDIIVCIALG